MSKCLHRAILSRYPNLNNSQGLLSGTKKAYRHNAFTLAEVLITLGIIGVVAAMTLPTLIAKNQEKVLETQRKKAASVISNGYRKMMADNEVFSISELPIASCVSRLGDIDSDFVLIEHKKIFNIITDNVTNEALWENLPEWYLYPNIGENSSDDEYDNGEDFWRDANFLFVTSDGFVYGVDIYDMSRNGNFRVYSDVNGNKSPNTLGKDAIILNVKSSGAVSDVTCNLVDCGDGNYQQTCMEGSLGACTTREECHEAGGSWYNDENKCGYPRPA